MKPWWMCCGWRSGWCVLDTAAHALHIKWQWVCDRHDAAIMRTVPKGDDWLEVLDGPQVLHHFETLEPAEVVINKVEFPEAGVFIDFTTGQVSPLPQTWSTGTSATTTWHIPPTSAP